MPSSYRSFSKSRKQGQRNMQKDVIFLSRESSHPISRRALLNKAQLETFKRRSGVLQIREERIYACPRQLLRKPYSRRVKKQDIETEFKAFDRAVGEDKESQNISFKILSRKDRHREVFASFLDSLQDKILRDL